MGSLVLKPPYVRSRGQGYQPLFKECMLEIFSAGDCSYECLEVLETDSDIAQFR